MRPYQVLLFIAACLCALATLCLVLPHRVQIGTRTLRWPTLAQVFETEKVIQDDSQLEEFPVAPDSLFAAAEDTIAAEQPAKPRFRAPQPYAEDSLIPKTSSSNPAPDSRDYLSAFYNALSESGERVVRVLHYGDSQIEEDRMTQQIREALQARYGGGGAGLMPLAQTIPGLTVHQELYMNGRKIQPSRLRRYMVYGLKRDQRADGLYGVMGQVTVMNDSLVSGSEEVTAVCTPKAGKHYSRWRVFADDSVRYTFSGDTVHLSGRGNVYGLSQESATGVIVDNIPMRGCLGLVFTKMSSAQLRNFYRDQNVKLIILQYGGNAIPFNEKPGTIAAIVSGLRDQVRYLKSCAPEASILFIGPSDMMRQTDGEWESYPLVGYMDRLLCKMAAEEEIAYFSLYTWMGGAGSMFHWQEIGLAGADGVHFHRAGARKAGNAVAEWLLEKADN